MDWVELYRIFHRPIKGAKVPSCVTTVNVTAAPTCPGLKSSQAVIMVILVSIVYSGLVFPPAPSAQQVPVSGYTGAGDTVPVYRPHRTSSAALPKLETRNYADSNTSQHSAGAWALHRQFPDQRSAL